MKTIDPQPCTIKAYCLLLLSLAIHCINAQVPFEKPLRLGSHNGLLNNWVTTVEEDADGIAWVGTIHGLYRWDGISVQSFFPEEEDSTSISSPNIVDVMPDVRYNKVWVVTGNGLSCYNTLTQEFQNFKNDPGDEFSIPDHPARRIYKDKNGNIWIGLSKAGLLRYNRDQDGFEKFLCDNGHAEEEDGQCQISVIDMQDDLENDSIMWLGTTNGIIRFNKISGAFATYHFDHEDELRRQQYNDVRYLTVHPNGKIYYAFWWYGLCSFDMNTGSFQRIEPEYVNGTSSFGRDLINGFHHASQQQFWINSNKGMQLYDIPSNRIIRELVNTDDKWYSIDHVDADGRIWSASHIKGLNIFNPLLQQYEVSYYEDYNLNFPCYSRKILESRDKRKLYVASEYAKGLYVYNRENDKWSCILPPEDFDLTQMGGFRSTDLTYINQNGILIVESSGLFYYEPGFERLQKYTLQPDKGSAQLRAITSDGKGEFWITSNTGTLYRLNPDAGSMSNYRNEITGCAPDVSQLLNIEADIDGNLWIQESDGLIIYNRKQDSFTYNTKSKTGESLDDLFQLNADPEGRVWVGADKRFGYGHKDSLDHGVIRFFDKSDGLRGNRVILALPFDDKLLLLTDKCAQVFNRDNFTFEKYYDHNYGPDAALLTMTRLSDHSFAHGKIRGIAFTDYRDFSINDERPKPYVVSMHAFDETIPVSGKPGVVDTVKLSYKENFFSFDFSAVNYTLPEETRFSYMLEGYDDEWKDGTKRRFASYTKVPGGEYRFLVKATNNEGLESAMPSATFLSISTVWWKTTWFMTMSGILALAMVGFIYNNRIAKVRREEQLKREYERKLADVELSALRAQMNPHFIFNSLNSIEYYIISNEPAKASDYLNRFSRLIRLILQNSKNTIVPLKDDLEALKLYIELESMRFEHVFQYDVKIEKGIDTEKVFVPPMLLQPYVENSIWHGLLQKKEGEGRIEVTISKDKGSLKCVIEDNGIGREAAQRLKSKSATTKKSFGMKITKDRLQMLNNLAGTEGSVEVIDLYDDEGLASGTRVVLFIPV